MIARNVKMFIGYLNQSKTGDRLNKVCTDVKKYRSFLRFCKKLEENNVLLLETVHEGRRGSKYFKILKLYESKMITKYAHIYSLDDKKRVVI